MNEQIFNFISELIGIISRANFQVATRINPEVGNMMAYDVYAAVTQLTVNPKLSESLATELEDAFYNLSNASIFRGTESFQADDYKQAKAAFKCALSEWLERQ